MYAIVYGIGPTTLATQLRLPSFQAKALLNSFLKKFPGIQAFQKRIQQFAAEHGFTETITKRRRYFANLKAEVGKQPASLLFLPTYACCRIAMREGTTSELPSTSCYKGVQPIFARLP